MRYIDKSINRFSEFEKFVAQKSLPGECLEKDADGWDQLDKECGKDGSEIKKRLHDHLVKEQSYLCIYCERKIYLKTGKEYLLCGHIEHIRPKDEFKSLVFEYSNLSISCDGLNCDAKTSEDCINIRRQNDKLEKGISCGHRKSNKYDKELFLNPFEEKNIESFFVYYSDRENSKESKGILISESENPERIQKARYMTEEVLDLNHDRLKKLREAVYNNFLLETNNGFDEEKVRYLLREDNNIDKLYEFHSMLKYF